MMQGRIAAVIFRMCAILVLFGGWAWPSFALTHHLTPPNRPALCSGAQGVWSGTTYQCTDYAKPFALPAGDSVIANSAITVHSFASMNLTNVTLGSAGSASTISLKVSSGSSISLSAVELYGNIIETQDVTLANATKVHGFITISESLTVNSSTVVGAVNAGSANLTSATLNSALTANNAIHATNSTVLGAISTTNGLVNFTGGRAAGHIHSNCCKVTVFGAQIEAGIKAGSNGIEITNSTVKGVLDAGHNPVVLTNVTMTSGSISAGNNNVTIDGGSINADIPNAHRVFIRAGAKVRGNVNARYEVALENSTVYGTITTTANHDGLHHVTLLNSVVYGNVYVRSDWGTITGNWPHSAIYGECEYKTVTPQICTGAAVVPSTLYYQLSYSAQALTCEALPVTVKVCTDASCGTLYQSAVTVNLAASNNASWVGGSDVTVTGSAVKYLQKTSAGPTTLSLTDSALSVRCSRPGCGVDFVSAALKFLNIKQSPDVFATQVAGRQGQGFLRAVQTNTTTGACEARVQGTHALAMKFSCQNPASCISDQTLFLGGTSFSGADATSYKAVNLTFDAEGYAPFAFNYSDVGRLGLNAELTVPSSGNHPAATLSGSTEVVVRPYSINVMAARVPATEVQGEPAQAARLNPQTKELGQGFVAAGEAFEVYVSALNAHGVLTPNFGNEALPEEVEVAIAGVAYPQAGQRGTLTLGHFTKATPNGSVCNAGMGQFCSPSVRLSEVGSFHLKATLKDADYLGTGLGAFKDDTGQESATYLVGRIYPKKFVLKNNALKDACAPESSLQKSFSYMGQAAIELSYVIEAQNLQGNVTQNYASGYQNKYVFALSAKNEADPASQDYFSRFAEPSLAPASLLASWQAGTLQLHRSNVAFQKPTPLVPIAPTEWFRAMRMFASLTKGDSSDEIAFYDEEDVTKVCTATASTCALAIKGSLDIRYGRAVLVDAAGPEDEDLPITLRSDYWNGHTFVKNHDDSCTHVTPDGLTLRFVSSGLTTGKSGVAERLYQGENRYKSLFIPAPGVAGSGVLQYELLTEPALPWNAPFLQYPWDGHELSNPTSQFYFGVNRGNKRQIFWKERF